MADAGAPSATTPPHGRHTVVSHNSRAGDRLRRRVSVLIGLIANLVLTANLAIAVAPGPLSEPEPSSVVAEPSGLPLGGPTALHQDEMVPPSPDGWIFSEAFPRTSGTQRLTNGALFWSGFLYDDHGALGMPVGPQMGLTPTVLSPSVGTFIYPPGPAHNNGADIAAAAVGSDGTDVWFRIDWQTLADPNTPIAIWAFDADDDPTTGADEWPASAGVRSSGNELWLVVSGRGSWFVDPAGARVPLSSVGGASSVDGTGSFLARVPAAALPPLGTWRIRLAAGLANEEGDAFAAVPPARGSLLGQPAVYDVAFRTHEQEPIASDNWWRERQQALALAAGDVTEFAAEVDWADLLAKTETPEVLPTGASDRWYHSALDMGPGIAINSASIPGTFNYASDFKASYLGPRQPYSIYVPSDLSAAERTPLTIMLHALNVSHQEFAILNPDFVANICEARKSICVAPLGRGPDGWWANEAELDVWEVWNRVAHAYRLDPSRTVLLGYSMGGYGSYRLGLEHPDLFAAVFVLAGAPACSIRVIEGLEFPTVANNRDCISESNTTPLIENARQLPFYLGHDGLDELAPITSARQQADRFDALGYRHRLEIYPNHDHVSWWHTGTFEGAVNWLTREDRQLDQEPRHITYSWYAQHQRPELGTGPGSVWWISDLRASSDAPGFIARVEAVSHAIVEGNPSIDRLTEPVVNADGPAIASELVWGEPPASPEREAMVEVRLVGVQAASIDLSRAGIQACEAAVLGISSSEPTSIRLAGLAPGTRLRTDAQQDQEADAAGQVGIEVEPGETNVTIETCVPDDDDGDFAGTVGSSDDERGPLPLPVTGGSGTRTLLGLAMAVVGVLAVR